jgi:plastocyanin
VAAHRWVMRGLSYVPPAHCVDTAEISAVDNRWKPACVIATSGDEITVTNDGSTRHILLMAGFEIYESLDPGDDATVAVPHGLRAGARNEFRCAIHPTMVGYIYDDGLPLG